MRRTREPQAHLYLVALPVLPGGVEGVVTEAVLAIKVAPACDTDLATHHVGVFKDGSDLGHCLGVQFAQLLLGEALLAPHAVVALLDPEPGEVSQYMTASCSNLPSDVLRGPLDQLPGVERGQLLGAVLVPLHPLPAGTSTDNVKQGLT